MVFDDTLVVFGITFFLEVSWLTVWRTVDIHCEAVVLPRPFLTYFISIFYIFPGAAFIQVFLVMCRSNSLCYQFIRRQPASDLYLWLQMVKRRAREAWRCLLPGSMVGATQWSIPRSSPSPGLWHSSSICICHFFTFQSRATGWLCNETDVSGSQASLCCRLWHQGQGGLQG